MHIIRRAYALDVALKFLFCTILVTEIKHTIIAIVILMYKIQVLDLDDMIQTSGLPNIDDKQLHETFYPFNVILDRICSRILI